MILITVNDVFHLHRGERSPLSIPGAEPRHRRRSSTARPAAPPPSYEVDTPRPSPRTIWTLRVPLCEFGDRPLRVVEQLAAECDLETEEHRARPVTRRELGRDTRANGRGGRQ